ncbi:MAG: hypothetical protein DCC75_00785 [Proteobacteria bacterium]|nr:MAG: hypothetical protein DCC75_00785 [Pseudomonadota bacterium]
MWSLCLLLAIWVTSPVKAQDLGGSPESSFSNEALDLLAAEIIGGELLAAEPQLFSPEQANLAAPVPPHYNLVAGCSAETKHGCSCEAEGKNASCNCNNNPNGPGKVCKCSDGAGSVTCTDQANSNCECKSSGGVNQ